MMTTSRVCALLLVFGVAVLNGQAEREPETTKATLCNLAQYPEQHNRKLVEVRASVAGNDLWIDDFEEYCSSWMGVVVVLPDQVRPRPQCEAFRVDTADA